MAELHPNNQLTKRFHASTAEANRINGIMPREMTLETALRILSCTPGSSNEVVEKNFKDSAKVLGAQYFGQKDQFPMTADATTQAAGRLNAAIDFIRKNGSISAQDFRASAQQENGSNMSFVDALGIFASFFSGAIPTPPPSRPATQSDQPYNRKPPTTNTFLEIDRAFSSGDAEKLAKLWNEHGKTYQTYFQSNLQLAVLKFGTALSTKGLSPNREALLKPEIDKIMKNLKPAGLIDLLPEHEIKQIDNLLKIFAPKLEDRTILRIISAFNLTDRYGTCLNDLRE